MERLKHLKEALLGCVEGQVCHLNTVDTKELGEAIDMIKDLEEAIYYCTITKAMNEQDEEMKMMKKRGMMNGNSGWNGETQHNGMQYYPYDMMYPPMYYNGNGNGNSSTSGNSNGGNQGGSNRQYYADGNNNYDSQRDNEKEGRSGRSRRQYMEAREMHSDKTTQMRELEKYMQELSADIIEMIGEASPEERQYLSKKITALATKVDKLG